jgi:ABC-type Na+ efflux pump permease subunit
VNRSVLIARKEAGELLLAPRGQAWLLAVAAALSAFGLVLVGSAQLSLLDNAQVVYDMTGIVTALGALLAMIVGIDAVAGERDRGSLVPLLLTPGSASSIVGGKMGAVAVAWTAMFVLAIPYMWAVGSTGQNLAAGIGALALLGTPVVLGFGLFGLGLGARLRSSRVATMTGLIALLVAASPLLIGPSLRQSALGRLFDAVNPFSAAVNAFDAVLIDSQAIAAQGWHLAHAGAFLLLGLWFARAAMRRVVQ